MRSLAHPHISLTYTPISKRNKHNYHTILQSMNRAALAVSQADGENYRSMIGHQAGEIAIMKVLFGLFATALFAFVVMFEEDHAHSLIDMHCDIVYLLCSTTTSECKHVHFKPFNALLFPSIFSVFTF